jgi:hypothetical protein
MKRLVVHALRASTCFAALHHAAGRWCVCAAPTAARCCRYMSMSPEDRDAADRNQSALGRPSMMSMQPSAGDLGAGEQEQ